MQASLFRTIISTCNALNKHTTLSCISQNLYYFLRDAAEIPLAGRTTDTPSSGQFGGL